MTPFEAILILIAALIVWGLLAKLAGNDRKRILESMGRYEGEERK